MRSESSASGAIGRFRWVICALLFFGVTKNYMDRQVLSVLKHTLQADMHWSEIDYSNLVIAFQIAYASGMVVMGRVIDRLGTRLGYSIAMVFWSVASMCHAMAGSLVGFMFARAALGFGEAGVFPASIKTVAEWFPRKERALATGIFNGGTNIGAVLAPLFIPWITLHLGWRWAFLITGALGFVWLVFWLTIYRKPEEHPRVSPAELAYVKSDPTEEVERIPWLRLLGYRQAWAFIGGKFLTDPIWWFYLFWVPDFLQRRHGLTLAQIGTPLMVIYVLADIGSVGGGWLPAFFIRRGMSINVGRKLALLICALCTLPAIFTYRVEGLWPAVALISLAASAHQGFSANLFSLPPDLFPSRAIGSVVGLGGMAGAIAGMLIAKVVGYLLQWTGSYRIPFLMAGGAYLFAWVAIQLLVPRLEPARF